MTEGKGRDDACKTEERMIFFLFVSLSSDDRIIVEEVADWP